MLYKTHSEKYLEDFGLLVDREHINLFENGLVRVSKKLQLSPVLRVNALWVLKDLRLCCEIAATDEAKKVGLQGHKRLEDDSALFFPYAGYTDVTFHQGNVSFPLDVIFMRDDEIVHIEADTRVGSKDRWSCKACTAVIETNAGFCFEKDVNVGDRVALSAVSQYDVEAVAEENRKEAFLEEDRFVAYNDNDYYELHLNEDF
jgi:uncharacterized membrane protein (UPF0127 family)